MPKLTFIDKIDSKETNDIIENHFNYCTDGMKILSLNSDDYVEQKQTTSFNLCKIPSISMNDVDFSKCNEVNINMKLLIKIINFFYEFLDSK